jgi:hypothetical protein
MKRIVAAFLMLLIAYSSAFAGDYIRLDIDSVATGTVDAQFPFFIERTCPEPVKIMGHSNGWVMTVTGAATWSYEGYPDWNPHFYLDWFNIGGGLFTDHIGGTDMTSGWFLVGGAAMPPLGGMPVITETDMFTLTFDIGPGEGAICLDSAFVGPGGAWKFSALTCGLGGAPDRPLFLAKDSSDTVHPICIVVYEQTCIPPEINVTPVGDELAGGHCDGLNFAFDADPGMDGASPATITGWDVVSGTGNIDNSGNYSAAAQPTGTYSVTIEVTNSCGESDSYSFDLNFTNSDPYFTNCPNNCAIPSPVSMGSTFRYVLNVADPDPCDDLIMYVCGVSVLLPPPFDVFHGTALMGGDTLYVATTLSDGGLEICVEVCVEDDQGEVAMCEIGIMIHCCGNTEIQIDKLEDAYQGHYAEVGINMNESGEYFGGFDFLVAYDPSALTFMNAALGSFTQGCWEYFTYRTSAMGNCGDPCGSGNVRLVGMADLNNGAHHPDPACLRFPGYTAQLAKMTFYVTNDYTFQCMYVPIRFEWIDCGDNTISSVGGDTLSISRFVYDFEGRDITGEPNYGGHSWIGDCLNPDPLKPSAIPSIDFIHGGIDIVCVDSIDARGDLNLNDIPYEIADAVLYTSYFIYGLGVFYINMPGQIAASDVNNDGRVLTVGDLVYLVRIITGDEVAIPKLSPFANEVEVTSCDVISTNTTVDIGAAHFVFDINGEFGTPELLVDGMRLRSDVVDGRLQVLLWSDAKNRVAAGEFDLFTDYYGNLMTVRTTEKIIPTNFALTQNYPNPFNSATEIMIVLPEPSEYKLEIYNVAGRLVHSFEGFGSNEVAVTWDASRVASGVYFYKATAGLYTATRKMVLMK